MLDQTQTQSKAEAMTQLYDLVVIGAGIAGLNALNAAAEYLPKDAKVLLLDQKERPGGMWNTAYDYVRLHQPHPMFTVGNLKWDWHKPRDYLAARDEVQSHLARSVQNVAGQVSLQTEFGQTVSHCCEVDTQEGPLAEIEYHPVAAPKTTRTVYAKRAIHAPGLNYAVAEPLTLSSRHVVSIIPQDLAATLSDHKEAPVFVIGGGKTGMDTVLTTLATDPQRRVSLVSGRGTNFINRTKFIPTGINRWTSGELVSRVFRDMALSFDGDNEDQTMKLVREKYSTDPNSENQVFLYGLQSEEEHARVKNGLVENHKDYLVDITDAETGPRMILRGGDAIDVPAGSIVVNCTGSFFRSQAMAEDHPLLSAQGCIMSINARNAFHFLTSVSGFFATHLLYREQLRGTGFYAFDLESLFRKDRNAWVGASAAHAYLNQVLAVQTLPLMLLDRCGLDLDRWYPFPRRMAGLVKMKSSAAADIDHCRRVLDRVGERFDIKGGPLA